MYSDYSTTSLHDNSNILQTVLHYGLLHWLEFELIRESQLCVWGYLLLICLLWVFYTVTSA